MRERGSAAVEFVAVLPLLLALALAVVEVGLVARLQLELIHAAREGAREAATVADPERAVVAARQALDPEVAARARVTVKRDEVAGGRAEVVVRVRHHLAAPLMGGVPVHLRGRAVMRVER